MRKANVFLILAAGFLMTGCSLDASILKLDLPNAAGVISFQKPSGAEFVSGALDKYETTAIRHYKVQASVGHFIASPRLVTPGRGYIVYSSVQGNMISDEGP